MSTDNIFVTGASGFIGRQLCSVLSQNGCSVVAVTRNRDLTISGARTLALSRFEDLPAVKGGTCIHLGESGIVRDFGAEQAEQNLENIAQLLQRSFNRIVYISTALVYGDQSDRPHSEDEPVGESTSTSLYVQTKLRAEALVLNNPGRANCVARLANVYGPRMSRTTLMAAVIDQLLKGSEVCLENDYAVRDYVYVEDVARGIMALCQSGAGGIFNIGRSQPVTVRAMVDNIANVIGRHNITLKTRNTAKSNSTLVTDCRKARNTLGWHADISLEQGIRYTLAGWADNAEDRLVS